ncbi:MAG TPA: peptidase T [Planctomycetes bacterium]|nr:peptidase T [Planctomycetota bacterium]
MERQRLLERFLRYVQIDTRAEEDQPRYPSCPGQLELGRLLVEELRQAGIEDACQDQHGIVTATIPANTDLPRPTVAFCAHLDTSPETPGADVKPQVMEGYPGGDIPLPGDRSRVIRVAEHPELEKLVGKTLITSDGTTLLGADDKAGVAAIMEAATWMVEHPEHPHGTVRLCFTCDEEIGRGVDYINLEQLGARVCYTLDGQGADTIDVETFSADLAVVTIRGVNIHPSIAKGRMTNAVRVAADFLSRLPRHTLTPETTADREGFLHPYEIHGGVGEVTLKILLRDFQTQALSEYAERLRQAARATTAEFPAAQIDVAIKPQYRNMAEGLIREPRAVGFAQEALRRLGRSARLTIVRGGTDGSRLTEMGLPTPNLATGQHAPHSPLEWACLEEILAAAQWIVAIVQLWAEAVSDED